jgi:hypothetical protein
MAIAFGAYVLERIVFIANVAVVNDSRFTNLRMDKTGTTMISDL